MKIASKWIKHRVLAQYPSIRKHLPETHLYSPRYLWHMLQRHGTLYIKPVVGSGGHGIIRVKQRGKTSFAIQKDMKRYQVNSKGDLLLLLRRLMGEKRRYLIQKGIHLISIKKRPIDYRLLILRPESEWKVIGTIGKWAAPGKIVTNHCRGGKPINLLPSLKKSLGCSEQRCQRVEDKINRLGMRVAETLGNRYRMRQMGLDIGIDKKLRIWILEVNTGPRYQLFRYHHDRTLYPKIVDYMRKINSR